MVAGHLEVKNGLYYCVLSFKDAEGKRKRVWIPTKLKEKGNKKRVEKLLSEYRQNYKIPVSYQDLNSDMLFADFLEKWLIVIKGSVKEATFGTYSENVKKSIAPYFRERGITLRNLRPKDIQSFYIEKLEKLSATTVLMYHARIHRALKYAVAIDLIYTNPADKVEKPKRIPPAAKFYTDQEIEYLFEKTANTKMELPILFAAFYGLRRGEIVGLKWDSFDFENNTIRIYHTVSRYYVDGKTIDASTDTAKTKASFRSLPLVDFFKKKLLLLKEDQIINRRICGNSYCHKFLDYVLVNEMGERINPTVISTTFPKILEEIGLRRIRFHDLRHSCASLLLKHGVSLKEIQEWLGHSNFQTTANIYAHLDYKSKIVSANILNNELKLPQNNAQKNIWFME